VSTTASSAKALRAFRPCKAKHPIYDTRGAELFGGRWNSKGTAVLYVSESRALSVLELLVHLTAEVPNKYVLGSAEFTQELVETVDESSLGPSGKAMLPAAQSITRTIGDEWVRRQSSAILSIPSVIVGERNFVLNPAHQGLRSDRVLDSPAIRARHQTAGRRRTNQDTLNRITQRTQAVPRFGICPLGGLLKDRTR
jgi:RES domain-containing protein